MHPSQMAMLIEEAWHWGGQSHYCWNGGDTEGTKDCNACFMDGHVKVLKVPQTGQTGAPGYDLNWFFFNAGWGFNGDPIDYR